MIVDCVITFVLHKITLILAISTTVCLWEYVCECVLTLDGDLGIGGGPPGLRVWLVGSFPLRERESERQMEGKKVEHRHVKARVTQVANNVRRDEG